jgi:hypothetical protein
MDHVWILGFLDPSISVFGIPTKVGRADCGLLLLLVGLVGSCY